MSEVKSPSCGRIVHFFPHKENDKLASWNGADKIPAIVVQNWGALCSNLSVFPMNPDATNVLRYSVPHLTEVAKSEEGLALTSYWDWPQIN